MDYVYNFCNRPLLRFDQHCREWYLDNNTDHNGNDIRMLSIEIK